MKKEKKRVSKTRDLSIMLIILILGLIVMCFVYYDQFIRYEEKNILNIKGEIGELAEHGIGAVSVSPQNLVLYLPVDDNTNDMSGNNNDGTLQGWGADLTPSGKFEGGLELTGRAGQYLDIGQLDNHPELKLTNNGGTISAWIYRKGTNTADYGVTTVYGAMHAWGVAGYNLRCMSCGVPGVCVPACDFTIANGTTSGIGTYQTYVDNLNNRWHHLVGGWNSTTVYLYVDGKLLNSTKKNGNYVPATTQNLWIGNDPDWNLASFNGTIDEIKIWDIGLSEQEIIAEYCGSDECGGVCGGCPEGRACNETGRCELQDKTLIAYYPFEGNFYDAIGNNDGVNNSVTLVSGKIGQAASFNGNGYITVPNNPDISRYLGITVCLWFKTNSIIRDQSQFAQSNRSNQFLNFWMSPGTTSTKLRWETDNQQNFNSTSNIYPNVWYHVCGEYDTSTEQSRLYINGSLDSQYSKIFSTTTNAPITIGSYDNGGTAKFNGTIDEVKIWNYALNDSEIRNEYSRSLSRDLIAYYAFEGNAEDSSGNGNHGNVHGATFSNVSDGKIGRALKFNGLSNYMNVSNSQDFNNLFGLTVSAWIKPSQSHLAWERIVDKGYNSAFAFNSWNITNNFSFNIANSPVVSTTGPLNNNWHHIAGTVDGTALKIYVDGVLNNTVSQTSLIGSNNYPLTIGADMSTNPNSEWFNGTIDELKIWNYALNSSEILQEYRRCVNNSNCRSGEECINGNCVLKFNKTLVAYYAFEGNGEDSSGKGNNGTVYRATFINNGKVGQGLKFNGNNSYVEVPNSVSLQDITENSYSWSLWFNTTNLPSNSYGHNSGYLICKQGWHTAIYIDNFSNVNFGIVNTTNSLDYSYSGIWGIPINLNNWTHVVGVVDNSLKKVSLYVNGILGGSQTYTGSLYDYEINPLRIGICNNPGNLWDGPFNGTIDEVKIWNYALSKREVANVSGTTFNCTDNSDCEENDVCTRNLCNNLTGACYYEFNYSISGCGCNSDADCSDSNICTTESCNIQTRTCSKVNNTLPCYYGADLCKTNGTCSLGVCGAGPVRNCSDNNNCTVDSCNTANGQCENSNIGCPCTNTTQCQTGNGCVTNFCNSTTSRCAVINLDIACNDSNANTIFDWCFSGSCTGNTICNLNRSCDPSRLENCSNCPRDCGNCSSSGGTGGGGGSGGGGSAGGSGSTGGNQSGSATGTGASGTGQNTTGVGVGTETPEEKTTSTKIIFILIIIILITGIFIVTILLIKSINKNSKGKIY